jgi:2-dehydro-3-deoxy-D-gluconate 5-dehydrogenase
MHVISLAGKTALVTGASRGLGAGIARGLAEAGADVVLHDLEACQGAADDTAQAIAADTGVRATCLAADVADREEIERLVARTIERMGRLDVLVNNAGIIRRAPAVEFPDRDWDDVIAVNLSSVFFMCRAAGRHMLERGSGKIVNIASLLSFQGGILVPSYAAAKAGVAQVTKALANEWAGRGVNVNAIAPGYMRTENTRPLFNDEARNRQITDRIPAGRWGEPSDLAGGGVCAFLSLL